MANALPRAKAASAVMTVIGCRRAKTIGFMEDGRERGCVPNTSIAGADATPLA